MKCPTVVAVRQTRHLYAKVSFVSEVSLTKVNLKINASCANCSAKMAKTTAWNSAIGVK